MNSSNVNVDAAVRNSLKKIAFRMNTVLPSSFSPISPSITQTGAKSIKLEGEGKEGEKVALHLSFDVDVNMVRVETSIEGKDIRDLEIPPSVETLQIIRSFHNALDEADIDPDQTIPSTDSNPDIDLVRSKRVEIADRLSRILTAVGQLDWETAEAAAEEAKALVSDLVSMVSRR